MSDEDKLKFLKRLEEAEERIVNEKESIRTYVGASAIGAECERKLWYLMHLAHKPQIDAKRARMFRDGNLGETAMAEVIKSIGSEVKLVTLDPNTGEQYSGSLLNGLVQGHVDGMIRGAIEPGEQWAVWEHKQVETLPPGMIKKLDGVGLSSLQPEYYAQAQIYMKMMGVERHVTTVASAGGRKVHPVVTEYDEEFAQSLLDRVVRIAGMAEPPQGVGSTPEFWLCNPGMCDYPDVCYEKVAPLANCGTCDFSDVSIDDGGLTCGMTENDAKIPSDFTRKGCKSHVYKPYLFPADVALLSSDRDSRTYIIPHAFQTQDDLRLTNGPTGVSSKDIEGRLWKSLLDAGVDEIKKPLKESSSPSESDTTSNDKSSGNLTLILSSINTYNEKRADEKELVKQLPPVDGRTKRKNKSAGKKTVSPNEWFDDDIPF